LASILLIAGRPERDARVAIRCQHVRQCILLNLAQVLRAQPRGRKRWQTQSTALLLIAPGRPRRTKHPQKSGETKQMFLAAEEPVFSTVSSINVWAAG